VAYSFGGELFIAHVGDSRCYLLRKGALYQLTSDHTVVQELVRQGILPAERAASHELRHVITNVVGGERPGLQVELHKVMSAPGDVVLLCSDGLTEMLQDDGIAAILAAAPEPSVACDRLVMRANELGGRDNVTVVVARFDLPT
jgi:protein phosphatase